MRALRPKRTSHPEGELIRNTVVRLAVLIGRGTSPETKAPDMAVQQNKVSKSRRNNRRSHDSLVATNPNECSNCGELKRPHHICASCGHYADTEVLPMADEVDLDEDAA